MLSTLVTLITSSFRKYIGSIASIVLLIIALILCGHGLFISITTPDNILDGPISIAVGAVVITIWIVLISRMSQGDKIKKLSFWILLQIVLPFLLPMGIAAWISWQNGKIPNWSLVLASADGYIYATYLGIAALGILLEEYNKNQDNGLFILFVILLTLVSVWQTATLISEGPTSDQLITQRRVSTLIVILLFALPFNIGARIVSML